MSETYRMGVNSTRRNGLQVVYYVLLDLEMNVLAKYLSKQKCERNLKKLRQGFDAEISDTI